MAKKEEGISEKAVHTPGPWKAGGGSYLPITAMVSGKSAQIGRAESFGQISDGECEANARLIAAAPELLESSLELLEMLKEGYGWNERNCGCDVDGQGNHAPLCPVIKLQSAIQKARGEQL